ncbi:IS110 family transposase [Streptomyces sp. NBC_00631]|uniref:IS110 family transposase n=1 Tax=Streptomyces sp. NBC_00631 TaxID=2975793 RepID=UPI0030E152B3
MTSNDFTSIDIFCAPDVGKSTHHGTALLRDGRTTFDKPLPNGEPQLRELFACLGCKGKVLVVVDKPASIGTLTGTVARACGCEVAYRPGLSMRRLADPHPGTGRTDARDAYVIADAARTTPHLLHSIDPDESVRAELTMVLGYDDDLAQEATRTSNRLRGLLTSIHPALERVLGSRLRHPAVLALLQTFGSPAQLAQAGTEQITQVMLQAGPRMGSAHTLAEQISTAPAEQTVTVPGTASAGEIVSGPAEAQPVRAAVSIPENRSRRGQRRRSGRRYLFHLWCPAALLRGPGTVGVGVSGTRSAPTRLPQPGCLPDSLYGTTIPFL